MTSAEPKKIKKKRGAQPGNHNALRHGFYSKEFRKVDLADLDTLEALNNGLVSEIASLRVLNRRLLENLHDLGEENINVADLATLVNQIGVSYTRIASLMRTQSILIGKTDNVAEAIAAALEQAYQELGIP